MIVTMNETRTTFDRWSFLLRLTAVAALATGFLIERLNRRDRAGAIVVVGVGYVLMPFVVYLHTRYYNIKFMGWVIEALRRKRSSSGTTRGDRLDD